MSNPVRILTLPWPSSVAHPTIWPPTIPRALRDDLTDSEAWMPWVWPAKNPGDILTFGVDITPWISELPGDYLNTVTVLDRPGGELLITNLYVNQNIGQFQVANGVDDARYDLTVTFGSFRGSALVRTFFLPVSTQYADMAPNMVDSRSFRRWFIPS